MQANCWCTKNAFQIYLINFYILLEHNLIIGSSLGDFWFFFQCFGMSLFNDPPRCEWKMEIMFYITEVLWHWIINCRLHITWISSSFCRLYVYIFVLFLFNHMWINWRCIFIYLQAAGALSIRIGKCSLPFWIYFSCSGLIVLYYYAITY